MFDASPRNLRTVERFLLVPPLPANFGTSPVNVCDISAGGARFRHETPLETGRKEVLKLPIDGRPAPVDLEAVVVWSQADSTTVGQFLSGVRTYGSPEVMKSVITQLQTSRRSNRIEELRSADRFFVTPSLSGSFSGDSIRIEDLAARGARIETQKDLCGGSEGLLEFRVPDSSEKVAVRGKVAWSGLKAIRGTSHVRTYRAGLTIGQKPELMRLAIAQLVDRNHATLDTQSLALKLKILRARARQLAPSYKSIEASGVPAEQYLLIQGVREELRLNPEEAMHWYRRARLVINEPGTREMAPMIADYPDALAVWEYLDRSVDPSIVGRALQLPNG
jgi:hypothetical protein